MDDYQVGAVYWVPDSQEAWCAGTLSEKDGNKLTFNTNKGRAVVEVTAKDANRPERCGDHLSFDVGNLVDLDELSEGAILHHIRKRFKEFKIYTHVGSILVAVNPFQNLDIYGTKDIATAMNSIVSPYPHVFMTGALAYNQLQSNCKNQSVLISGESGAGKTETTKKVLTYLAHIAPDTNASATDVSIETKILQSNPLLEGLGNAKTLRNNNSSRFGKWMQIDFDSSSFRIQGCQIQNYLLEKSRVVTPTKSERNYHIFYQMLSGMSPSTKESLSLRDAEQYNYLNGTGCFSIPGVDDAEDFKELQNAMNDLQFDESMSSATFELLAAILHLGNVEFSPDSSEGSQVATSSAAKLNICAQLLGLEKMQGSATISYALTQKQVRMGRGSVVSLKLDVNQCVDSRDTLAKSLYSRFFDWVIQQVNKSLASKGQVDMVSIGILDIFGFEVFQVNSFEQLCINYANEKLQLHFNGVIFGLEQEMYKREGIDLEQISFKDNSLCVALIEGKPLGLISLLEEECSLGNNGTDLSFMNKVDKVFGIGKPTANEYFIKNRTKASLFSVCHFAGAVEYTVTSWLDKSRDTLSQTLKDTMKGSTKSLVSGLFAEETAAKSSKSTVGGQFRNQLIGLINGLQLTEPHFIRCVKPNDEKVGGKIDGAMVLQQLKYAGLFEAIRIRKAGYSFRMSFQNFATTYKITVDGLSLKYGAKQVSDEEAAKMIVDNAKSTGLVEANRCFVGVTRVFFKNNSDRNALDAERSNRVTVYAVRIKTALYNYILRLQAYMVVARLRAERKRKFLADNAQHFSILQLQARVRGYLVRKTMGRIQKLMLLRQAVKNRDLQAMKVLVEELDRQTEDGSSKIGVAKAFARDIKMARLVLDLIHLQEQFVDNIEVAIATSNIKELNRLVQLSERLEMQDHPSVQTAVEELQRLEKKRRILKAMVAFLQHEDQHAHTIVDTLKEARRIGVEPSFMDQVWEVYERAGPKLSCRRRLKAAVEVLDRYEIEQACLQVFHIRESNAVPEFAETEIRAARMVLRLLHFDGLINDDRSAARAVEAGPESNPSDPSPPVMLWGLPVLPSQSGPKLSSEEYRCCCGVVQAASSEEIKRCKLQLQAVCGSLSKHADVVRYFKWVKVACTWRYPEVQKAVEAGLDHAFSSSSLMGSVVANKERETDVENEFFGLRPQAARASSYVIRTLHKDFLQNDLSFSTNSAKTFQGSSSALLEAALSNIEVPSNIAETLAHLEELSKVGKDIKLPNGDIYQRGVGIKPATPVRGKAPSANSSLLMSPTTSPQKTPSSPMRTMESFASSPSPYKAKPVPPEFFHAGSSGLAGSGLAGVQQRVYSGYCPAPPREYERRAPVPVEHRKKQTELERQLQESRHNKKAEYGKVVKDLNHMVQNQKGGWK